MLHGKRFKRPTSFLEQLELLGNDLLNDFYQPVITGPIVVKLAGLTKDQVSLTYVDDTREVSLEAMDGGKLLSKSWIICPDYTLGKVTMANGLLTIALDKVEPEKPKSTKIDIE